MKEKCSERRKGIHREEVGRTVEGHGFSRAVRVRTNAGLQPLREAQEDSSCQILIRGNQCKSVAKEVALTAPLVEHSELESSVRREQLRHFTQPLGQRRRRQQRIVALPQIVIIHIEIQRQ